MMRLAGTSLVFYRHSGNFVYVILSVATLAPHAHLPRWVGAGECRWERFVGAESFRPFVIEEKINSTPQNHSNCRGRAEDNNKYWNDRRVEN